MIINWKNTAENLFLVLVGVVAGVAIGYYVSIMAAEAMLENQKAIITEAIKKETTAIHNTVTTEINKVKNRKGEPINIVIEPYNDNELNQQTNNEHKTSQDSIPKPEKKRGFFKRLFGGKKNKK
ncbi:MULTISPECIES: hypothetical protein [Bizionia]|uniref:Uncharacterized protein n=1 Tax=Bizionia algoritergicola TaxID=291187 RepID=A0A5D0R0T7_9FLAO|nr:MULTISPECIES: hypothetical protein [Bizionia]OBX20964.1 hypothetical protein BAA08_14595 [Bizionia sp. APA-3]TYB74585.1 hypothetical protein ES675_00125 [Bizionia algoritergicola]